MKAPKISETGSGRLNRTRRMRTKITAAPAPRIAEPFQVGGRSGFFDPVRLAPPEGGAAFGFHFAALGAATLAAAFVLRLGHVQNLVAERREPPLDHVALGVEAA